MRRIVVAAAALAACGHREHRADAPRDAAVVVAPALDARPADPAWAALAGMPRARPRWSSVARSFRADDHPVVAVQGPLVLGGWAVVAGARIGVVAIDLSDGREQVLRSSGAAIVVVGDTLLAVDGCPAVIPQHPAPPTADPGPVCYEVSTVPDRRRVREGHVSVPGRDLVLPEVDTVARAGDAFELRLVGGERLSFALPDTPDLFADVTATPLPRRGPLAPPDIPPVTLGDGDARVDLWLGADDVLELRYADPSLLADRSAVVGFATAPGALAPAGDREAWGVQKVVGEASFQPVIVHVDGLAIGTLGAPVPGQALLAAAYSAHGFALAVRLDAAHDYIAAFTPDGTLTWVYPLPVPNATRRAPVGLAMTDDAVVVFRDGDTVEALPQP